MTYLSITYGILIFYFQNNALKKKYYVNNKFLTNFSLV